MRKRAIWELFLLAAGTLYMGVVLCDNVQCSSFAVVFVALAGQVLVTGRREKD